MLRGCQKKIIFLKDTRCEYFEGAYFVINPEYDGVDSDCIVAEATKIANGIYPEKRSKKGKNVGFAPIIFSAGMILGAIITVLCYFMFG